MGFGEAISACFRKYVGFSGRARRSEYWWFVLFTVLVGIVAGILDGVLGLKPAMGGAGNGPIGSITSLALFLPSLAVAVRRLHDTDRSGFWLLGIYGVMIAAVLAMVVSVFGAAAGGGTPNYAVIGVALLVIFAVGIWFLVLMCTKGTTGTNRFGADPTMENAAEEFK